MYRRWHHHELTFSLVYAFTENFILPLSHDEVVHGKGSLLNKMPGDKWQKLANLRSLYAFMWAHPGKKLLFMGGEFAQEAEWSDERSLDWHLLEDPQHAGMQSLVRDLNHAYKAEPALWELDFDGTGVLVDRGQRRRQQRVRVRAPHARLRARGRVRRQPVAGAARELPARPAALGPLARGWSTPTRGTTAGPTSATSAASRPAPLGVAEPAVLGRGHAAAARRPLARAGRRRRRRTPCRDWLALRTYAPRAGSTTTRYAPGDLARAERP